MNSIRQPAGKAREMRHWSLLLLLLGLTAPAMAAPELSLQPFEAVYEVSVKGIPLGHLTQRLERPAPAAYYFTSILESTGLARLLRKLHAEESSTGTLTPDGLRPESYTYFRRSGKKEKRFALAFDWAAGRVSLTHSSAQHSGLEAGTLDKLSLLLGVMHDLASGAQALSHRVADADGIKTYTLTREEAEPIDFEGQRLPVIKVSYARGNSGRRTTLWCAPALQYLPLRIEYRERDGELTRGRLVSFSSGTRSSAPSLR